MRCTQYHRPTQERQVLNLGPGKTSLITGDGRWKEFAGLTVAEVTFFPVVRPIEQGVPG